MFLLKSLLFRFIGLSNLITVASGFVTPLGLVRLPPELLADLKLLILLLLVDEGILLIDCDGGILAMGAPIGRI